jgi:hypothetical protein
MLLDILSKIDEKINSTKDTKLDLVGKDYIEKYLYIKTKDKELIPLLFNPIMNSCGLG